MNKINFTLQMRLKAVQKRAAEWSKHNPEGAYQSALDHQVKYGRKGWIKYDSANEYDTEGNLCLYNLESFDCVDIQDISRRAFDYSGYYADNFQHEIIAPKVARIKTKKGFFLCPAIAYSDCDIATIYISKGEFCSKNEESINYDTCALQMARIADSIAERKAEQSRDDDAKFQAEQITENLREENYQARIEAHKLISAIKDQRKIGDIVAPICNALISEIKAIRGSIQANNRRIQALKDNYWLSVN